MGPVHFMTTEQRIAELEKYYSEARSTSPWLPVEQEMINRFGEATGDLDWLHVDPERARREGPFGGTIAYGFWTLSMLTALVRKAGGSDYPPGTLFALNYGFDRVRLMAPVPVGSRIRSHSRLLSVEPRDNSRFLVKTENQVEVEGTEKPALIAEWLILLVFPPEK